MIGFDMIFQDRGPEPSTHTSTDHNYIWVITLQGTTDPGNIASSLDGKQKIQPHLGVIEILQSA